MVIFNKFANTCKTFFFAIQSFQGLKARSTQFEDKVCKALASINMLILT